jgi:ribosome-binding protein aMBF1 (putative translation factor)
VQTILQQLQVAYERTGWTMEELATALEERGGIKLDRSSLRRQMIGENKMRTDVAEALAQTMEVTLAVVPDVEAAS